MVVVLPAERKSAVLSASSLACLRGVPTINLTCGCGHECVYCYARGYSNYPGDGRVRLYTNTLVKLREELRRKRKRPEAVYFSPSSDLFQPVAEVLEVAYGALELLFELGIGVSFLTKGRIPGRHMELLKKNAELVRGQIGLTTLDEEILRTFEPHAALPGVRLAQVKELVQSGIAIQARLDPILPGLTDEVNRLDALCAALAHAGVRRIAAGVLFMRPAIISSLRRRVRRKEMLDLLVTAFGSGMRLGIYTGKSSVTALSTERRREIYDRVKAIARDHGLTARVCACKNPDLARARCGIGGRP